VRGINLLVYALVRLSLYRAPSSFEQLKALYYKRRVDSSKIPLRRLGGFVANLLEKGNRLRCAELSLFVQRCVFRHAIMPPSKTKTRLTPDS
jgi:hypothetical protein